MPRTSVSADDVGCFLPGVPQFPESVVQEGDAGNFDPGHLVDGKNHLGRERGHELVVFTVLDIPLFRPKGGIELFLKGRIERDQAGKEHPGQTGCQGLAKGHGELGHEFDGLGLAGASLHRDTAQDVDACLQPIQRGWLAKVIAFHKEFLEYVEIVPHPQNIFVVLLAKGMRQIWQVFRQGRGRRLGFGRDLARHSFRRLSPPVHFLAQVLGHDQNNLFALEARLLL
mmetsp:Transcript_16973/g.46623  ORF Transcript_16973/g.46623 Transcript_16973/m.46623 type:complete len:227 (+) Transcript_16973:4351-5031(+)